MVPLFVVVDNDPMRRRQWSHVPSSAQLAASLDAGFSTKAVFATSPQRLWLIVVVVDLSLLVTVVDDGTMAGCAVLLSQATASWTSISSFLIFINLCIENLPGPYGAPPLSFVVWTVVPCAVDNDHLCHRQWSSVPSSL
jgi:hypothetical protein